MNRMRFPLYLLGFLLFAVSAQAQYELKSGNFNNIFVAQTAAGAAATPSGPPVVANPPPTSDQFSAMGQINGSTSPLSTTTIYKDRYPSNPDQTLVLVRVTIGNIFASGVPRFFLGDIITTPLAQANGITPASPDYWRAQPVQPGETFKIDGTSKIPFPTASVNVSASATNLTSVTVVAPLPPELIVGATILGQPITRINGTNITLAGNANTTISTTASVAITPAVPFYYSPHAGKVFASQAGRVTITWVTRVADVNGNYILKTEDFAVSSNTQRPVRTIYWTEGGFDGPKVAITDTRITTVNPAYYSVVPKAVAQEVTIPGNNPISPNLSTLSFDKFSGLGQLHAYNVEGRIFIEYLGNVRLGGNIHEFIGSDVVEIVRVPEANYMTVHLGKEISPHEPGVSVASPPGAGTTALATATVVNGVVTGLSIIDGGSGYGSTAPIVTLVKPEGGVAATASAAVANGVVTKITLNGGGKGYPILTPSPALSSIQNGGSFYGTSVRADSSTAYFAERVTSLENTPDNGAPASQDAYNKVIFYWLEEGDFSIQWPKFQDRYWLRWSPNLGDYAHYTVDNTAGNSDTGLPFTQGTLPSIVYQDDPAQSEAAIDLTKQCLFVNFASNSDQRNRSLLKFSGSSAVWYVNLYSQGESRMGNIASGFTIENGAPTVTVESTTGLEVGMIVTGPGIDGSGTVVRIIDGTRYVISLTSGLPSVGQIANSSFEADGVPAYPGYVSAPGGISGWTRTGKSGLNSSDGPFADNGTIPNGSKVAFIQNDPANSYLLTTVTGLTVGRSYEVSLSVNARAGNTPSMRISVDGTSLLTEQIVSGAYQTKKVIFTAIGNTASLKIENTTVSGDNSLLLDNVTIRNYAMLAYTIEGDAAAPINTQATVGSRLIPPAGFENAGYISGGTGYYPQGYLNPFIVGVAAANKGAIIPVNARPTDRLLTVRWFKKVPAPSADFQNIYVPGKIGRYTVSYPVTTNPQIVIAQGVGTGDLTGAEAEGTVFYQNDLTQPGYNPNEEHAFPLAPRAYALRDDLNVTSGPDYTSEPFVLMAYTDAADSRPAMHAYKVLRTNATYNFDFTATAGTLLVKPYPLPLLPAPMIGSGATRMSKDVEVVGADAPTNTTVTTTPAYKGFTFKDRKGFTWVHRGPHSTGTPTLAMKLYYLSREGFFIPGTGVPNLGTVLPFLRAAARSGQPLNVASIDANANGSPGQVDEPLTILYRPSWPVDAPELRVAETLTLPKFGLPQVRGQSSAQILYQQSIANALTATGLTKNSVVLHDPTREKTVALDAPAVGLAALPAALKTTAYQGKTYFQGLPPHLQKRFYYDPLRGAKGTLVLTGVFHDEVAGEDYLDLNLLSISDDATITGLIVEGGTDKTKWDAAIRALTTKVETFKPDPARFGSYIVDTSVDVGEEGVSVINSPNTAVDSYAITSTGQGAGYVTMVFGDGKNPDQQPEGDPVQVKVFKVATHLYTGDLKVLQSSNPLDEQVTLRQSGDFAGKPQDYEFQWRWTTGAATAPGIYSQVMTKRIGNPAATPASNNWIVVSDPGAVKPTDAQYAAAPTEPFPRTEIVRPVGYTADEIVAGFPAIVAKSTVGVDFSTGVPGSIVFSASLGNFDGFVLYVNNRAVLAHNAPTPQFTLTNSSSGLTPTGLPKQFSLAPNYFTAGLNTIEVAIYTTADQGALSPLNFMLEAAQETDVVSTGGVWQTPSDPTGKNTNIALIGSSTVLPFGGPQFVLNDRWFTMRYRPKSTSNSVAGKLDATDYAWSRWMPPQFVEGWVKRVLAAINPFEQRIKDLYNNGANTDVSVITQAGKRWEGDIALTMDNINDAGLIEIYETVLNRAKGMSIDANTNDPDANNALTLAAGYLNDLYTILGNEATSDAANPTVSIDDQNQSSLLGGATEVNTSRFSFESQVASSLDEELALLRGRDDRVSPGVTTAPAYNRLYWNYTRGINSGEVIYAVNYNIKEKVGSSTANGVIDEYDAQRMFPQGHGDAYGHYLTALTGYYRLLNNKNFTWTPRAEAVTVLGQPVTVDYMDERKFAAAAGNVAKTAQQITALTWRQSYKDAPEDGWASFRDTRGNNPQTGITSRQGLDEWVSRGTQGAYLHWAVANALVPDVDNEHSGIQKIDRTTVPEIPQLAMAAADLQATIDSANAHLNPLGLSPGAIAFDLDPNEMKNGKSHYEQVSERALRALNNAKGSFDQAAKMTRSLRSQQNSLDDYNTTIAQQERAYVNQLLDIYGSPYSGDVGAGKLYAQGYTGPDLLHWFIVDRPNDLVNTSLPIPIKIYEADQVAYFSDNALNDIKAGLVSYVVGADGGRTPVAATYTEKNVSIEPSQWVQYNDTWKSGGLGSRTETGSLQEALQDAQQTLLSIKEAQVRGQKTRAQLEQAQVIFEDLVDSHLTQIELTGDARQEATVYRSVAAGLTALGKIKDTTSSQLDKIGAAISEAFPKSVGLASDVTSPARSAVLFAALTSSTALKIIGGLADAGAAVATAKVNSIQSNLAETVTAKNFTLQEIQLAYEYDNLYRDYVTQATGIMQLTVTHQRALQKVNNVIAKGNRLLAEREIFRQRAAAIIQGQRTKDLTFRIFRNEALEQYRSLFDLASRYSYLAAKSYDYETGLLGTSTGKKLFDKIVSSRSLGDLSGGVPQSTSSTLGDSGLAGTMAQLNADFSVAKGRLGINNPDQYGTVFSLRTELYRLLNDPAITSDDDAWQQTLEQKFVPNLLNDSDVATYCRNIKNPNGNPVPGIIIPFSTTIQHGKNFFGLDLAAGDHAYTPTSFATKIFNVGIALPGYVGMDSYAAGNVLGGTPANGSATNALSATPYVYLIPCGADYMLAPPLGDTNTLRSWNVNDQALPLPYNLGKNSFNDTQFFSASGTLSEQPWILRKHQAFRMVSNANMFYSTVPAEFTNSRLIGRSVWNGQWKIVIPAYTLLKNEQEGLNRFAATVKDVQLFIRTYSHSGN